MVGLFSTAHILKKTNFLRSKNEVFYCTWRYLFLNISLGKFEIINYCKVGDFFVLKLYSESLQANDFTILSERTLFIQKFVKLHIYAKLVQKRSSFLFLFLTR